MTARRRLGRGATLTIDIAATVGLLCLLGGAVALLTGVRPIIFQTGSMSPGIPAGSLAITVPVAGEDVRVGQVVSAPRAGDGTLVTHRVVGVQHHGRLWLATMRGDANQAADAAPYDVTDHAQRLVWSVPGVGQAVASIRSPWLLLALLALLIVIAVPTRRARHRARTVSRAGRAAEAPETGPGGRSPRRPPPAPSAWR